MLSYQLLNNHAGLLLVGDYTSLRLLREIVHDVNERSPLITEEDGPFLGLAYDVRKAYEQQREILPPPQGYEEMGTRYGVQILWPVLLLQQRTLRVSLGYLDHSRRHQAITYALEAVIEEGLQEDFGPHGQALIDLWQRLDPAYPSMFDKLDSRGAIFCSWGKVERKRRFATLLASFDPMYESHYTFRAERGETGLLSPQELVQWENLEWPDPRW
ncbi:MAG: hypothetical protein NVV67_15995 [Pseudoxanthomonas sp.]|nr:hypothetical protein [Pseudoxanthomonas sp.]